MMPTRTVLAEVADLLRSRRYTYNDETHLQGLLADVLVECGWCVEREVVLVPGWRIDLMVGRVGIEVKIAGGVASVASQLQGYARTGRVDALMLVTTRFRHTALPTTWAGIPVRVVYLRPNLT